MGFLNSLKGQIGRDTGRVVSNVIWKDKHASVYRKAESRKQQAYEDQKEQVEYEREQREKERNLILSGTIDQKIENVVNFDIPDNDKQLVDLLNKLSVLMKSNSFSNNEDSDVTNRYSEAILIKYEHVLLAFMACCPSDPRIKYYEAYLKKSKRSKFFKKFWWVLALIPFVIYFLLGILGVLD